MTLAISLDRARIDSPVEPDPDPIWWLRKQPGCDLMSIVADPVSHTVGTVEVIDLRVSSKCRRRNSCRLSRERR